MRSSSCTTHGLAIGGMLWLYTLPAMAQQASDWLSQPTMTGDWGGTRTQLQDDGINLRAHWTTESAGNVSGGLRQTARYTQQLDFGVDFDLDKLWGVPDAKIQVTVTDRRGRSLTNDALDNLFSVQELYGAGQNFRLAELNWQQDFLDHKVTIQLGWSPIGDDLARLAAFCNFQNGIICGHANAMTTNSGAHNFPTAQWGARVKVHITPTFYVQGGVYQNNPNAANSDQGWNLSFKSDGVIVPVEVGWSTSPDNPLPGSLMLGAYYNSAATPDVLTDVNGFSAGLTGAAFLYRNGRSGGYFIVDKMVYREGPGSNRGLTLGAMGGVGDSATAKFRYFWIVGGHYQGTFSGRDNDFVSFMVASARINPRLTRYQRDSDSVTPGAVPIQTYETVFEVDYGAKLGPWLTLRPNLQYIARPDGTGTIPNAFVIGLYTQMTF
ncbi:carbohydrate porin [Govanella unica]|uniref:Carbohydrate porin n=1 Tax=Govanella unica TaxID=2975056 RepID=A0A9X3Z7X2_9PROT|nr:carbohydrate porin [Govania unica]MDA5194449.1 carbohydrate porin [Govania unica]